MDSEPFLTIDITKITLQDMQQLSNFKHDNFEPEALRNLAEESIYLTSFIEVVTSSLQNVDVDFVKYIAKKANIQRQLNNNFLLSITPLVKQAIQNAVSGMVVSGLSTPKKIEENKTEKEQDTENKSPIIDPTNSKIVTTWEERQLLVIAKEILPDDAEIEENDTESYYAIIYGSKKNRWIFRYYSDRKYPVVTLPFEITEQNTIDIERSGLEVFLGANQYIKINKVTDLLRISWLILQSYEYCSNDENFKRK